MLRSLLNTIFGYKNKLICIDYIRMNLFIHDNENDTINSDSLKFYHYLTKNSEYTYKIYQGFNQFDDDEIPHLQLEFDNGAWKLTPLYNKNNRNLYDQNKHYYFKSIYEFNLKRVHELNIEFYYKSRDDDIPTKYEDLESQYNSKKKDPKSYIAEVIPFMGSDEN